MKYKLICFDMDGVIFEDINFWLELHKTFGTFEQGKILTEKYLHSDYNKLVEKVVNGLWKGKPAKLYFDLIDSIEYLPGVEKMFSFVKKENFISAIVSASSIDVARRVQKDHGVDHLFANELVIKNNVVSGEFIWPVGAGKQGKAKIALSLCNQLNISPAEAIFVGDSDNDIEAFKEVGLSIAFNSCSNKLKAVASEIVESNDLSDVIKAIKKHNK